MPMTKTPLAANRFCQRAYAGRLCWQLMQPNVQKWTTVTLPFREASESLLPAGTLSQESPISSGAAMPPEDCADSPASIEVAAAPSSPSATDSINRREAAFRATVVFIHPKIGRGWHESNGRSFGTAG